MVLLSASLTRKGSMMVKSRSERVMALKKKSSRRMSAMNIAGALTGAESGEAPSGRSYGTSDRIPYK